MLWRDPYNIKCHIPVTSKVSEGLVTWYAVYYSSSHLLLIIRYVFSIYSIMSDLYLTTTSLWQPAYWIFEYSSSTGSSESWPSYYWTAGDLDTIKGEIHTTFGLSSVSAREFNKITEARLIHQREILIRKVPSKITWHTWITRHLPWYVPCTHIPEIQPFLPFRIAIQFPKRSSPSLPESSAKYLPSPPVA